MSTSVLLICHGVTDWDDQGRVVGRRDPPLNQAGRDRAREIAACLAEVTATEILTSPLQRAVETADAIVDATKISCARDPRLADLDGGHWEGQSHSDVIEGVEFSRFLANPVDSHCPGGERLSDVAQRARMAIEQAVDDVMAGERVLVVTHTMIVSVLLMEYIGAPLGSFARMPVAPGSITGLHFGGAPLPRILFTNWVGSDLKEQVCG